MPLWVADLIISEYLNFDKAFLEPEGMVIYGQPGAYLNMGEIESYRIRL
ncbi:MAG: hypothetical protein ACLRIT_04500 [Blautia sp.]